MLHYLFCLANDENYTALFSLKRNSHVVYYNCGHARFERQASLTMACAAPMLAREQLCGHRVRALSNDCQGQVHTGTMHSRALLGLRVVRCRQCPSHLLFSPRRASAEWGTRAGAPGPCNVARAAWCSAGSEPAQPTKTHRERTQTHTRARDYLDSAQMYVGHLACWCCRDIPCLQDSPNLNLAPEGMQAFDCEYAGHRIHSGLSIVVLTRYMSHFNCCSKDS